MLRLNSAATVVLLLLHGMSAFLLLGAITHQAWAVWWPRPHGGAGWWNALGAVHPERYVRAVIVLLVVTAALGAIEYLPFRVLVRAGYLDEHVKWATGLFEIKEHATAMALSVLPAYAAVWRDPGETSSRRALTTLLAAATWWNFLVGHVVNNVRGM